MSNISCDLSKPLEIGAVRIPNRVILAPMSGVSDRPFRRLASRFGAGLVVSEMVATDHEVAKRDALVKEAGYQTFNYHE